MEESIRWLQEKRIQKTLKALRGRGFRAHYFSAPTSAAQWVLEEARDATFIGVGGSVTVRELGVVEVLQEQGKTLFDHWQVEDPHEALKVRRSQLTCDLFLSGINAVTESGEIVNMDGSGNRVAAMAFGPRKVILVGGINKLVSNLDEAYRRIRRIAAPVNAHRLGLKTPCAKGGECTDCDSPQRICNVSLVLHRRPIFSDVAVVLIGRSMGY